MRFFLLALAVFYAWLPSCLCAGRLQIALFPSACMASEDSPDSPGDDDDGDSDDPNELHCRNAKPPCIVPSGHANDTIRLASQPALAADQDSLALSFVARQLPLPPFQNPSEKPLYLTLRALRI